MTQMQHLPEPTATLHRVAQFNGATRFDELPGSVTQIAKLLLLDLIGVTAAASKLKAGELARTYAIKHWQASSDAPFARLLFDGRVTSLPGFGFAVATQLDNLDAHDGWQPSKGHAGAALFPALCAFAEAAPKVSGREALTALALGYEIAYRAAYALHATVNEYHTSGAWNALGCVAVGGRLRGLDIMQLRSAFGIAEYHAPRSQMMREIINPSMLHDGTGWGVPTGIYAVLIAEDGFHAGPAATVEFDDAAFAWKDLGERWLINEQYIKPYPVCRWAHAPIDAALQLKQQYGLTPNMIQSVEIETFVFSADLSSTVPTSSPAAQYSLAWPVAAALVRGRVGVDEILEASFTDKDVVELTQRVAVSVNDAYEAEYPDARLANVKIRLQDGRIVESGTTAASGGPDPQPTEADVRNKYRSFAASVLPEERIDAIESAVLTLDDVTADFKSLLELLVMDVTNNAIV